MNLANIFHWRRRGLNGAPGGPDLDEFREGVWLLQRDGQTVGHAATIVETMWAPFHRQECVWVLVTWIDGHRERVMEDYAPFISVQELRDGHLVV